MTTLQTETKPVDEFTISVLTNLHDSLKWVLTILMSGAAAQAAISLHGAFDRWYSSDSTSALESLHTLEWSLAVFFVFALTFLRFYWGAVRFFDLKYLEIPKFIFSVRDLLFEKKQEERYRSSFDKAISSSTMMPIIIDVGSIFYQATFFFVLARSIDEPEKFIFVYMMLLFFNAVYLFITLKRSAHHRSALEILFDTKPSNERSRWLKPFISSWHALIGKKDHLNAVDTVSPLGAPQIWILNNTVCGLLLLIAYQAPAKGPLYAFCSIAVMILNCGADFLLTHKIYIRGTRTVWKACYDAIVRIPAKT